MKPFDPEALASRIRQLQLYKPKEADILNSPPSTKDIQHRIIEILNYLGVPIKLKGYQYLIDAIVIVADDISTINSITKKVYPVIASKNKISSARVERAIRNAIEITWTRGNLKNIYSLFENDIGNKKTRPSNSDFISKIVYILLNNNE
jgi:two-component system response regulator (stage 0 sporulation protein A)